MQTLVQRFCLAGAVGWELVPPAHKGCVIMTTEWAYIDHRAVGIIKAGTPYLHAWCWRIFDGTSHTSRPQPSDNCVDGSAQRARRTQRSLSSPFGGYLCQSRSCMRDQTTTQCVGQGGHPIPPPTHPRPSSGARARLVLSWLIPQLARLGGPPGAHKPPHRPVYTGRAARSVAGSRASPETCTGLLFTH